MRDLIFFSLENWDEVWRRNQFVCAQLARRFPDRRILFVGKPIFVPQLAKWARTAPGRAQVRAALRQRFWRVPELPNIRVFNPIKPLPNPAPGGRQINENWQVFQVRRAARRAGVRDPLLWINPYDCGFYIGRLGERGVVYDITDDWELAARTPQAKARIADQDRDLCARADLTVVCSPALFESRQNLAKELLLLPNGVDAAHYARIDQLDNPSPGNFNANGTFQAQAESNGAAQAESNGAAQAESNGAAQAESNGAAQAESNGAAQAESNGAARWPRPVFGYTGTLHRERIDLDLVVQLARAHPGGSVVLVGPHNWTDDSLRGALAAQPNLHAPGPVAYRDIPTVMAHFDVCVVPHRRTQFVESLNPIKLWEYLAAGKPIVSTDVAGFRDYPQWVRLANDAPAFVEQCRAALGEIGTAQGANLQRQRRAEAAAHSWGARVDQLLQKWRAMELIEKAET